MKIDKGQDNEGVPNLKQNNNQKKERKDNCITMRPDNQFAGAFLQTC